MDYPLIGSVIFKPPDLTILAPLLILSCWINFPLQDITNCGEGLLESMLKVVIWCINSPEKHFAEVIKIVLKD